MKRITFHMHEIVGANNVYNWMKELEFQHTECVRVSKLIKHHQFRFYEDSNRSTIRKWLEEIGHQGFEDLVIVRLADRAGNLKNKDKPLYTKELTSLINIVNEMITTREVVFVEDLAIGYKQLNKLGVDKKQQKEAISNMLGIVRSDSSRNTTEYLTQYIQKNYLKGKTQ